MKKPVPSRPDGVDPSRRERKPRPAIAVRPSFVSQENTLVVLGVDARRYLEHVVPLAHDTVVRLGKLRLLPIDVAESALLRLASTSPAGDATDDEQPSTAGEVLAVLGRELAS